MRVTKTAERCMGDSQRTGAQAQFFKAVNECFSLFRSCVLPPLPTSSSLSQHLPPRLSSPLPLSLLLLLSLSP